MLTLLLHNTLGLQADKSQLFGIILLSNVKINVCVSDMQYCNYYLTSVVSQQP